MLHSEAAYAAPNPPTTTNDEAFVGLKKRQVHLPSGSVPGSAIADHFRGFSTHEAKAKQHGVPSPL